MFDKKILKIFKKTIDKIKKVCYNKDTIKKERGTKKCLSLKQVMTTQSLTPTEKPKSIAVRMASVAKTSTKKSKRAKRLFYFFKKILKKLLTNKQKYAIIKTMKER